MFNLFHRVLSFFSPALLLNMVSRTDTTTQLVFSHPLPFAVTYDFNYAAAAPNPHIRVIVSAGSKWEEPLHWTEKHTEHLSCEAGGLHVYRASSLYSSADLFVGPGFKDAFDPGILHSWRRSDYWDKNQSAEKEDLVTHVYTEPGYAARHELFYRNVNSAILDAARYPYLRSTPLWVRLLFSSLNDGARTALIAWILRLQLMVMYHQFDFWPYLGSIPLDVFWT